MASQDSLVDEPTTSALKERKFQCLKCGKRYLSKSSLYTHGKSCGIKYSCSKCEKLFATETARSNHEPKCKYECDICNKDFKTKARLENHINTIHSVKSFKCEICETVCGSERVLTKHMRTHTTELLCHVCGKIYHNQQ